MSPGDRQMIHAMKDGGMKPNDICYRYRHRYPASEVLKAMESKIEDDALRKAVEARKAQRPKRKRRTKAQMEAARNVGSVDM